MKAAKLKIGDKIRIIDVAGNGKPGYYLHADTRRVYKLIMKRSRPVRINQIDKEGTPWFTCRFRRKDRTLEHHYLAV
jgi:hypothetical protein